MPVSVIQARQGRRENKRLVLMRPRKGVSYEQLAIVRRSFALGHWQVKGTARGPFFYGCHRERRARTGDSLWRPAFASFSSLV